MERIFSLFSNGQLNLILLILYAGRRVLSVYGGSIFFGGLNGGMVYLGTPRVVVFNGSRLLAGGEQAKLAGKGEGLGAAAGV